MSANWPPFNGPPSTTMRPSSGTRYVLYDREPVWGPMRDKTSFFQNNQKTVDGRLKDGSFTNLYLSGSLGFPLSIEVAQITVAPVAGDEEYLREYDRFAKSYSVFEFLLGQNNIFVATPLALMNVKSVADRIYRDRITNEICNVVIENGALVVQKMKPVRDVPLEGLFADSGSPRFINVTTPDKRLRWIDSTMMFRADIYNAHKYPGSKEIDVYVCLEGFLHYGDVT